MEEPSAQPDDNPARLLWLLGAAVALGVAFDQFFYGQASGISYPIYIALLLVVFKLHYTASGARVPNAVMWLAAPSIFFSVMVFVRANAFLTFLNISISVYLLLAVAALAGGKNPTEFKLADFVALFALPILFFGGFARTLGKASRASGRLTHLPKVFSGIMIAIPILALLLILLSAADLVFEKYVSDLLDISPETIFRILLVILATALVTGFLAYSVEPRGENGDGPTGDTSERNISVVEMSIVLGSMAILFFSFILVQFTYFFGGKSNVVAKGFTYAQYARRGFFELVAVALVTFIVLRLAELFVSRPGRGHSLQFKVLSGILIAEVLLIMISAFMRLLLYEQAYGFTTLRLYSHVFVGWLAVVFLLLLYKIIVDDRENVFVAATFATGVLFLAIINLLNPDAFIARQNIARFENTGKLDTVYLATLSDDAIPVTVEVLDLPDKRIVKGFAPHLEARKKELTDTKRYKNWQSTNLSRRAALRALEPILGNGEPGKR